jgi:hypothetical protein
MALSIAGNPRANTQLAKPNAVKESVGVWESIYTRTALCNAMSVVKKPDNRRPATACRESEMDA